LTSTIAFQAAGAFSAKPSPEQASDSDQPGHPAAGDEELTAGQLPEPFVEIDTLSTELESFKSQQNRTL
jgi:hypothetical protein